MSSLENEIREAVLNADIDTLIDAFSSSTDSELDKRAAVDGYLKTKSVHMLRDSTNLNEDIPKLLEFCFDAASKDFASKTAPALTLTDIFEATPIDKCEQIFRYVEENSARWKSPQFIDACRTQLLRMCNDLLRRLSRIIDTEFCGRILIFLARCLPLTEKSGLNLTSQFNVDNVTKYDLVENSSEPFPGSAMASASVDGEPAKPAEAMEVEEGETDDAATSLVNVDYNLYVKFWQLQQSFATPNSCFDKYRWRQFQHNANEILNTFSLMKLEPPGTTSKKALELMEEESADRGDQGSNGLSPMRRRERTKYFAKYLTSQKLLHLQFNDNTFRRYVLVQFLILFQYLGLDVKFKDKKLHILNDEQTKWVEESSKKCYELLAETYPCGDLFVRVVQQILAREEHWNAWKNAGCDDFTKRSDKERMPLFKKRPRPKYDDKKFDLGNPTLSELWNVCSDNFEACRSEKRRFIPDLEAFLEEPVEQMDAEAGIEEKYKLVNDENFQWRALRLLCMKTSHFITSPFNPQLQVGANLNNALEKAAMEFPKYKSLLESKADKTPAAAVGNGLSDSVQQQDQEIRTDTNEEEEAEFQAQIVEGPGEQLVASEQISNLSMLIGSDWIKLATELDMDEQTVAPLKKMSSSSDACQAVLTQWCEGEGSQATVKRLRNVLLKAELFNEDVSAILITAPSSNASNAAKEEAKIWNQKETVPAKISHDTSNVRAATPVLDERQSTNST